MNRCISRFVVLFQIIISATTLTTLNAQSPIVLSEIMFNPSGNENYTEFIEIYNSGGSEVNLTGYWIGDGVDSDELIDAGWGITLSPFQFAVILDNGYFENSTDYDSLIPSDALILTINGNTFGSRGLLTQLRKLSLFLVRIVFRLQNTLIRSTTVKEFRMKKLTCLWETTQLIGLTHLFLSVLRDSRTVFHPLRST